jgi:hypothetical protein
MAMRHSMFVINGNHSEVGAVPQGPISIMVLEIVGIDNVYVVIPSGNPGTTGSTKLQLMKKRWSHQPHVAEDAC